MRRVLQILPAAGTSTSARLESLLVPVPVPALVLALALVLARQGHRRATQVKNHVKSDPKMIRKCQKLLKRAKYDLNSVQYF